MLKQRRPITPEKALERLESLCARSEQASGELLRKLRSWGISGSKADEIISSLTDRRFVDDERFAGAFVRDKVRYARWGRRKIRQALYQKGIASEIISKALAEIDEDEYESVLAAILSAKARTAYDITTYEGRTQLYRHGLSRGFEPDLVARLLRALHEKNK
mgnify:CR=1 FL=1